MSEKRVTKSYEELEFRDDFMFGKVMEDTEGVQVLFGWKADKA